MRPENTFDKIDSEIMNLPVSEQIHLIKRIARRVRSVQAKSGTTLNWNDLYGSGKGTLATARKESLLRRCDE